MQKPSPPRNIEEHVARAVIEHLRERDEEVRELKRFKESQTCVECDQPIFGKLRGNAWLSRYGHTAVL